MSVSVGSGVEEHDSSTYYDFAVFNANCLLKATKTRNKIFIFPWNAISTVILRELETTFNRIV